MAYLGFICICGKKAREACPDTCCYRCLFFCVENSQSFRRNFLESLHSHEIIVSMIDPMGMTRLSCLQLRHPTGTRAGILSRAAACGFRPICTCGRCRRTSSHPLLRLPMQPFQQEPKSFRIVNTCMKTRNRRSRKPCRQTPPVPHGACYTVSITLPRK